MVDYAGGKSGVIEELKLLQGQVKKYYDRIWASEATAPAADQPGK